MSEPERAELLERDAERAVIRASLVRAIGGDGELLLVEGEAGIGKTGLMRDTASVAATVGARVLTATAGELEQDLPYGIVRQLFEPVVREAQTDPSANSDLFAGAARFAEPLLMSDSSNGGLGSHDSVLLGLYWMTVGRAETTPVVLVVDDLQWCDQPSLQFLAYLARRLSGLSVLLCVAERTGAGPLAATSLIAASGGPVARVQPTALSVCAVGELAAEEVGLAASLPFAAACQASTGGNPYLVGELLRELAAEHWTGAAEEADAVREVGPRTVADAVLVRLARLPAGSIQVAQSLAVLGDNTELRHVAKLAGLEVAEAGAALAGLSRHRIVDDARPLRFTHPIVRRSIYEELTVSERAVRHGAAAQLLLRDGAPDEVVATHVLLSEPAGDAAVVLLLRAAATRAMGQWDMGRATRYLQRAVAEPPPSEEREDVLRDLHLVEVLDGQADAADRLDASLERTTDVETRVFPARILAGRLLMDDRAAASMRVLLSTLEAVRAAVDAADRPEDRERLEGITLMVEADLVDTAAVDPTALRSLDNTVDWLGRVDQMSWPTTYEQRVAMISRAGMLLRSGVAAERCNQLLRAARADGPLRFVNPASPKFVSTVMWSILSEDFELAASVLDDALVEAHEHASVLGFAQAMMTRSFLSLRQGEIGRAEADAQAVEASGAVLPAQLTRLWVGWWVHALALAARTDEAADVPRRHGLAGSVPPGYTTSFLLEARGWLAMVRGDVELAAAEFLACGQQLDALNIVNPAVVPWRAQAALALVSSDASRARSLAIDELTLARTFGTPRTIGMAMRAVSVTEDGPTRLGTLHRAGALLDTDSTRLEQARVLVDTGMTLRRARRRADAREPLRAGLDLAERIGARALADRAERELRSAGAKPRRRVLVGPSSLTPSERRVAEMAADGLTNRQIAQQLFVSLRTVENHLSGVFRKLGIQSRTEVAGVLQRGEKPELAAK